MTFTDTIPRWKMPDEEKIPHTHKVVMRFWSVTSKDGAYYVSRIVDLTEQYDWAEYNGIEMEHNMMLIGGNVVRTSIMFTFWSAESAMAFKLRWL